MLLPEKRTCSFSKPNNAILHRQSNPNRTLMEKRIGSLSILISNREVVPQVNQILSDFADLILARQGLPIREQNIHFISLIIEGRTDDFNALTGKLGRLSDVEAKTIVAKKIIR